MKGRIPLEVKVGYSLFMAVLIPAYLAYYGPANFLWICDIALLLTLPALWLESPFLASMNFIAATLVCLVWTADFLCRLLTGSFLVRMTAYMFNPEVPYLPRFLSLYHVWFPALLVYLVARLGYDRRGWMAQTALTWVVLPICYAFTDPARMLNIVFSPTGPTPQEFMPPLLYLLALAIFYPAVVFFPTHLVGRRVFPPAR